jgi:hypothetical protein
MSCINYKFRSGNFLLLLVCAAGLCLKWSLLLVTIAGLSGGAVTCFFFFSYAFGFLLPFLSTLGMHVAAGGVASPKLIKGYSMGSGPGWFESLPDLHVSESYTSR